MLSISQTSDDSRAPEVGQVRAKSNPEPASPRLSFPSGAHNHIMISFRCCSLHEGPLKSQGNALLEMAKVRSKADV